MGTHKLNRRTFLAKAVGSVAAPLLLSSCATRRQGGEAAASRPELKRHTVTLSFDDGFKKSSIRTAEIYEKYGVSACINVIARGHLDTFEPPDKWIAESEKGDFVLWNELQARGHEIMPHSYKHTNLSRVLFREAKDLIERCLDYFHDNLKDFERGRGVFNFPYNKSTAALEEWLPTQVRAFRARGGFINPPPHKGQVKLLTGGFGPGSAEEDLSNKIDDLLRTHEGWLIYNLHGLDGEGWGPIRSVYLERLLERLVGIDSVAIMPAGRALLAADA